MYLMTQFPNSAACMFVSLLALWAMIVATPTAGAAVLDRETEDGQERMVEETIFSRSLRFQGDVIEVLPSGKAIRQVAIHRGRRFMWAGKLEHRVATPESTDDQPDQSPDVDSLTLEDLAESLRGLALFNGHQFIEAEPAYDIARTVKQYRERERAGASREELEALLPSHAPSQGTGRRTRNLRHIEGASDAMRTEQVHGTDDRVVFDNTSYPHRVQIVFDNTGSTTTIDGAEGSGALIGPSTAMSVAHVFWDEANDTWEADYLWAPGFDSQDANPSPWGVWYRCYWVTIPVAYTTNENQNTYDYAVLDFDVGCNSVVNGVNSDAPGSTVGWLGHYTASSGDIEALTGYVRGYPGLGTCGNPSQSCNVRVWGDISDASENDVTSAEIRHQADSSAGMSGSAFYHYADPSCSGCGYGPYLVGIHRAGSASYNVARQFDSTVYSFMQAYSSDY